MSQLGLDISLHGQWIPCLNLTDFCELDAVIPASQGEVIWWDQVLVVVTQLFSHSVVSSSLWSQWTAARQASLSFTISQSLFKLMSTELMMPSNPLILCRPLLLPTVFPSIRVFFQRLFFQSQLFASGGLSIGASASASVLTMNIQGWFPLGLTGLISLQSKGLSRVFSPQFESVSSLALGFLYVPTLTFIYDCWKNHSFD